MVQSVTTKLGLINLALSYIGERTAISSDDSQASVLAKNLIQTLLFEFSSRHNWSFLIRRLITDPLDPNVEVVYTDNLITVNSIVRITKLMAPPYNNSGQVCNYARFVDWISFFQLYASTPYPNDNAFLETYTYQTIDNIYLFPYPDTDARKAKLVLYVYINALVPNLDTDTFNVPEDTIPALAVLLESKLHRKLLNDLVAEQQAYLEYEKLVGNLITNYSTVPYNTVTSVLD